MCDRGRNPIKRPSGIADEHDKQWAWNNFLSQRSLQQADNVRAQLRRSMESKSHIPSFSSMPEQTLNLDLRFIRIRFGPSIHRVRGQELLDQHSQSSYCRFLHASCSPRGREGSIQYCQGRSGKPKMALGPRKPLSPDIVSLFFQDCQIAQILWSGYQPRMGDLQRIRPDDSQCEHL